MTVERAIVLTGGWQTSKETAYVEATRARQRTDWHIAHQDLELQGQDPHRITRLAQRMTRSRAHTPTTTQGLPDPAWDPTNNPSHAPSGPHSRQNPTHPTTTVDANVVNQLAESSSTEARSRGSISPRAVSARRIDCSAYDLTRPC